MTRSNIFCISGSASLFVLGIDSSARLFDPLNQRLPLDNLVAHVIDRALQHEALGATLALQPGHELGESVEAFADGLPTLLFCARSKKHSQPLGPDAKSAGLSILPFPPPSAWPFFFLT
jgi:hypothetical protein